MSTRAEFDTVVIDSGGNTLSGVEASVKLAGTGTDATIYNTRSGGGTLTNPIETLDDGLIQFWAEPGSYDITVSDPTIPARISDRTITWESLSGEEQGIPQEKIDGLTELLATIMPPGTILATGRSSAPTGFFLCNGASLVRATYPDLFAAIGTTFGAADGTHFNVPDLRGRVPVGVDSAGVNLPGLQGFGLTDLGDHGGAETIGLTAAQMPAHTHDVGSATSDTGAPGIGTNWIPRAHNISPNVTITSDTGSSGSGDDHLNVQPYQIVNYIIKS